ncbi:MAG: HupE/UreJ family protein [Rhodospirillales bacterium]|nr:HupE/UreJ family protein [Rhodospirillales bacterium]
MDGGVGGLEAAMTWARALAAVAAVSLAFGAAVAHQGGTTGHAMVSVAGQSVRYALSLPAEGLGEATRDLREFAAAVARHVAVEADGAACSGVPAETRPPSAGRASIEVVVLYACAAPIRNLSIRDGIDALLGVDHHTIADIQWPGGARQVIFEKGQRLASFAIADNASPERGTAGQFGFYLGLGVEHIIGGIDHLLFLLALLALATSLWQTVKIVTAFTVAHSITLSLAALGVVDVPSSIVEPLIAASIVWVAVENLVAPAGAARRWLIAGVFGLIHGLGFASMLTELGLSQDDLVRALIGFNIGVELGQLAFVAVVMPPLVWLARPGRLPHLPQILSVIVALVGAVWLVERLLAV